MPDAGVAAVRYPQGSGRNRERDGVGEAEQALGQRTPVLAAEKPISEVLQAGRDEVGAGAGAVAVTVTPEELAQACVIGQVRSGSGGAGERGLQTAVRVQSVSLEACDCDELAELPVGSFFMGCFLVFAQNM